MSKDASRVSFLNRLLCRFGSGENMIRRWAIQCDTCECTDVAHEMDDGDMVFLDDIKPLIAALYGTTNFVPKEIENAHNHAVKELKRLLSA